MQLAILIFHYFSFKARKCYQEFLLTQSAKGQNGPRQMRASVSGQQENPSWPTLTTQSNPLLTWFATVQQKEKSLKVLLVSRFTWGKHEPRENSHISENPLTGLTDTPKGKLKQEKKKIYIYIRVSSKTKYYSAEVALTCFITRKMKCQLGEQTVFLS